MNKFADLYFKLQECDNSTQKLRAIISYLRDASQKDSEVVIWLLNGNRLKSIINISVLRNWILSENGIPEWLYNESLDVVKDQEETLAYIIDPGNEKTDLCLTDWIEQNIYKLQSLNTENQRRIIINCFLNSNFKLRLIFLKLLTGKLKLCCDKKTFIKALSIFSKLDEEVINYRLTRLHFPQPDYFKKLFELNQPDIEGCRPYQFMTSEEDENLSLQPQQWIAEWKWKGIRIQVIKRNGRLFLWSKDHEFLSDKFPEIQEDLHSMPDNIVLDAQVISHSGPEGIQKRLNSRLSRTVIEKYPISVIAFDILEYETCDLRKEPLYIRKEILHNIFSSSSFSLVRVCESFAFNNLNDVSSIQEQIDYKLADGLLLKDSQSPYFPDHCKWYALKKKRTTIRTTLLYIQREYQNYEPGKNTIKIMTFGVPDGNTFVSVAKTDCSLSEEDIFALEQYIKENTTERIGPIRVLKPGLIFELTFDEIIQSSRHKSGINIISPKLTIWNKTLTLEDVDRMEHLRKLILR